jgi:hypothetical protein
MFDGRRAEKAKLRNKKIEITKERKETRKQL